MADYVKMWKDLGMDLESHDMLCQVLPTAVGDVFMTQENRPKAMDFWDLVISEVHGIRPAELIEEQKKGRKVFGTFCVFVPDEVIVAADGIVTGLCGGSQFWVPGGEAVLPKNTCPLIKASVGARLGRTCPFFRIADVYVGETTCDGKKKAYEILGKDVPMLIMDVPQMKRPKDILKWKEEIADFAVKVEEITGNQLTVEKLKEAIRIINEKRKAMKRVYEARKAECVPISGRDTLLMTQISFFDDPERCAKMCNRLADELEERVRDGVSVVPEGTKRILVTGTPLAVPNWIDTDNPDNPLAFRKHSYQFAEPVRRLDGTFFPTGPKYVVDYGAFHSDRDGDSWPKNSSGWCGSDWVAHLLKNGSAVTNAPIAAAFAVWGTSAGGNQLLGGYDQQGTGLLRDYTNSTLVAENIAKPILGDKNNNGQSFSSAINRSSLALLNGNEILLQETPPSGAYDVVSFLSPYKPGCSSLGFRGAASKSGGLQMGELILYADSITTEEARRIDAYLNYKWFGREPGATCRAAHVGVLDVAAGATVNVEGNAPIVCSALKGAGTVNGDVRIGGDTVFEVFVNADGSISPGPAVSGAVDMSHGGTVRLTGYVNALAVGDYQLIASSSVNFGGEWTIEGYEGRKKIVLRKRSDGLWLSLVNDAFVIIIR